MRSLLLPLSSALLFVACATSGGSTAKSPADVAAMTSMDKIMHLQSAKVGPVLRKHDQTSFKPDEIEALKSAAQYVVAIGTRLEDAYFEKKFDGGFKMFATQLKSDGSKLAGAAAGGNAEAIGTALKGLGATCKGCHAKYQKH